MFDAKFQEITAALRTEAAQVVERDANRIDGGAEEAVNSQRELEHAIVIIKGVLRGENAAEELDDIYHGRGEWSDIPSVYTIRYGWVWRIASALRHA